MKQVLLKDKDFASLSIPATDEEMVQLEQSLIREGCKEPIVVWKGCILDGYKRYQICSYEEIDFDIEVAEFDTKEEAISWVCRQRIPHFPKTSDPYRYLVGKLYNCQKIIRSGQRMASGQQNVAYSDIPTMDFPWSRVSLMLSSQIHLSRQTIERHGMFALALDQIAAAEPTLFEAILAGKVSFQRQRIMDMAKMDQKKLTAIRRKALPSGRVKMRDKSAKRQAETTQAAADDVTISVGIKEMPKYDPDAELKGLCLTIPTWLSAIERAETKSDMKQVSDKTKRQLSAVLTQLDHQIQKTLEAMQ